MKPGYLRPSNSLGDIFKHVSEQVRKEHEKVQPSFTEVFQEKKEMVNVSSDWNDLPPAFRILRMADHIGHGCKFSGKTYTQQNNSFVYISDVVKDNYGRQYCDKVIALVKKVAEVYNAVGDTTFSDARRQLELYIREIAELTEKGNNKMQIKYTTHAKEVTKSRLLALVQRYGVEVADATSTKDTEILNDIEKDIEAILTAIPTVNKDEVQTEFGAVDKDVQNKEIRFQFIGSPIEYLSETVDELVTTHRTGVGSVQIHAELLKHRIGEVIRGLLSLSTPIPKEWPGLPHHQEPKYTVLNNHIVNRHSGEEIPYDEPIMIFRGRDAVFPELLEAYRDKFDPTGSHYAAIDGRLHSFRAFAHAYPERMKIPDTWLPGRPENKEPQQMTEEEKIDQQIYQSISYLRQAAGIWHDGFKRDRRLVETIEDAIKRVTAVKNPQMVSVPDELERMRMQIVACSDAAMSDIPESRAQRLNKDSPYWTVAYEDICRQTDKLMQVRSELRFIENQSKWGHTVTLLEAGQTLELTVNQQNGQSTVVRRTVSEKELYNLIRGMAFPNGRPHDPIFTEWYPKKDSFDYDAEVYRNRVRAENICGELTNIKCEGGQIFAKWIHYENDRGREVEASLHTLENQSHLQLRVIPRLYLDDEGILRISCFDVDTVQFAFAQPEDTAEAVKQ